MSTLDHIFIKIFRDEVLPTVTEDKGEYEFIDDHERTWRLDGPHFLTSPKRKNFSLAESTLDESWQEEAPPLRLYSIEGEQEETESIQGEERPESPELSVLLERPTICLAEYRTNEKEVTPISASPSPEVIGVQHHLDQQSISPLLSETCLGPESLLDTISSDSIGSKLPEGRLPRFCRRVLKKAALGISAAGDVLYEAIRTEHKVIAFKGMSQRSGCSTLLLGTACELGARGLAVLVIDGNFSQPHLASFLSLHPMTGWEDIVIRKQFPEEMMARIALPPSEQDRHFAEGTQRSIQLLPLVPSTVSKAIVVSCKREWMEKVQQLAEQFDLVLIDSGSLSSDSIEETTMEMLRFGVDGFILVEDARKKTRSLVPALVDETRRFHLPCLGIIANFV